MCFAFAARLFFLADSLTRSHHLHPFPAPPFLAGPTILLVYERVLSLVYNPPSRLHSALLPNLSRCFTKSRWPQRSPTPCLQITSHLHKHQVDRLLPPLLLLPMCILIHMMILFAPWATLLLLWLSCFAKISNNRPRISSS